MPSTSIHFPDSLLAKIDRAAKSKRISRNRFIRESCEMALAKEAKDWPEDFFSASEEEKDLRLLREAAEDMEKAILANRKSRKVSAI